MASKKEYWSEIFNRYKASGISQQLFCKQNGLSSYQFQYHWQKHKRALKPESQFESIVITPASVSVVAPENRAITLSIHLPNQIRCDIATDLKNISSLIFQLVQQC